ncbi:hypothetical protein AURDEDRAFT_173950 [Auricularia subglabra TFB-10046 SS5]|uniref:F-box domain-containing protein n=1 Tax=Auricularia subglabra (strain TFB-10046 / SS5) TaxID=717982 RepID=J0DA84_AURST|nr:hypothetical protein AURDEDRAFT_173950 [Auricularia subglabra TFB-10046 SS5]
MSLTITSAVQNSFLLYLPDEVLYEILLMLTFGEMVQISQICRKLRRVATTHSKLWQHLPTVTVSMLHNLDPFIEHSRALGFDLEVWKIALGDLPTLGPWLHKNLGRIRKLCLDFNELTAGQIPDANALAILHNGLSRPAPLLEILTLEYDWFLPFLGSLRPDILGGVIAPKLRELSVTAFTLDVPCPGLQGVQTVRTSVGGISPRLSAAQNLAVHSLFPAIKHLALEGIHGEDAGIVGNAILYPLARVPPLDGPLSSLTLSWTDGDDWPDARAAAWLASSVHLVQRVELETLQCALVAGAVLASHPEKAHTLHISRHNNGVNSCLALAHLSLDSQVLRSAILTPSDARSHLHDFLLGGAYLRLEALKLSTDQTCMELLKQVPGAWDALPKLRTLSLNLEWSSVGENGWFITPETLLSIPPMNNIRTLEVISPPAYWWNKRHFPHDVDLRCTVAFSKVVLPKSERAIFRFPNRVSVLQLQPIIQPPGMPVTSRP